MTDADSELARQLRPPAAEPSRRSPFAWRVARQAARSRGDAPDSARDELLARIAGGSPTTGNRARLFFEGRVATRVMLDALASAQREILLESYIFADDATGRSFADELIAAAGSGVEVRVLADAFGSLWTGSAFWQRLRDGGIQVLQFRPLFDADGWQPYRDHRKILVVDRRIAFTGGMNVADEYASFRRGVPLAPDSMRDTHVSVEGAAAWDMTAVFAEGWRAAGGGALKDWAPPRAAAGEVRVLVLSSRPGRGYVETAAVLAALVATARERVWITVGYFAPHRRALSSLCEGARRGLDVRLLLPGRTDVPLVRHAGHASFGLLLESGVRLFEYRSAVLHAKTMVVDRSVSVVGSSNLDFRSFRYNAECNLVLLDRGCAERLAAAFTEDLEASGELDLAAWRERNPLHRAADGAAGLLTPIL